MNEYTFVEAIDILKNEASNKYEMEIVLEIAEDNLWLATKEEEEFIEKIKNERGR